MNDNQTNELKTLQTLFEKTGMLGTPNVSVKLTDGKYRIKNSDPMNFDVAMAYLQGFIHGAEFTDDKLREKDNFPEYTKGEIASKAISECDKIDLKMAIQMVIESGKFNTVDFLEAIEKNKLFDELSFAYDVIVFSPKTMSCKYEIIEAIKKSSQMNSGEICNNLFHGELIYFSQW